jgi:REP element-mobilizing transposase RayT
MYFITICTDGHFYFFGKIVDQNIIYSQMGKIAYQYWVSIPKHFKDIKNDSFIIMPNHVHGILIIDNDNHGDDLCRGTACRAPMDNNIKDDENINYNDTDNQHMNYRWSNSTFMIDKSNSYKLTENGTRINDNAHTSNIQQEQFSKPTKGTIPTVIRSYKSAVTRWCRQNGFKNFKWQSNYYERVIRNENELYAFRKYIYQNPLNRIP